MRKRAKQSKAVLTYLLVYAFKLLRIVVHALTFLSKEARFPFPCSDRFIFGLKNGDFAWEVVQNWEDSDVSATCS